MPFSTTEVANLALTHIGTGIQVENVDTDPSAEGDALRATQKLALETLLTAFDWWFARKIVALALVATDPNKEWPFSFRWPADCLKLLRILSGQRIDDEDSLVSHVGGVDSQGKLIFTDEENAEIEYTFLPTDMGQFPAYFVEAWSWKWAELIAPRITKEDPFDMAKKMKAEYMFAFDRATVAALSEEQRDQPGPSKSVRSRR